MYRFLKFSSLVINTAHITHISKTSDSYIVHFVDHRIDGFLIFGGGGVNSDNRKITFCKKSKPDDYMKLEQWINEIPTKPS